MNNLRTMEPVALTAQPIPQDNVASAAGSTFSGTYMNTYVETLLQLEHCRKLRALMISDPLPIDDALYNLARQDFYALNMVRRMLRDVAYAEAGR